MAALVPTRKLSVRSNSSREPVVRLVPVSGPRVAGAGIRVGRPSFLSSLLKALSCWSI